MAALIKNTFIHDINQPSDDSEMRRYRDQMFWHETVERKLADIPFVITPIDMEQSLYEEQSKGRTDRDKKENTETYPACTGLEAAYQKHRKEKPF